MAAVSSQVSGDPTQPMLLYKQALAHPHKKESCQKFNRLAKDHSFSLHELALIHSAQYCKKPVNWMGLSKQIKRPVLRPFLHRAQFEAEFKARNFTEAYRVYDNHRDVIKINEKEFDEMATQALKAKLSPKEKKELRIELRKKSPRFIPHPKKSEYAKVARDFRNNRQFEKALLYYRKIINDKSRSYKERWRAFRGARMTYKLERWSRMKKYIKATKQWAHFLDKEFKNSKALTKMHHDANIDYVRTLWTEKGQTAAKPPLLSLEKALKGRYSMQMVYWLKGRMAEERKNYKTAVDWLEKAAEESTITLRDRDRVWWALAWNQRRIGQFKQSQKTLEKLQDSPELTYFSKSKYLYWKAENLLSMGKEKEGKKAFARLAEFDPYGYYGALALRKLDLPFPKPPQPEIKEQDLLAFLNEKDRYFFKELIEAKEYEVSEALVLNKVKYQRKWPTEKWVSYLNLLQKAGAYKAFFIRYHSLPPKKQLAIQDEHPYLLFPQPYREEVLESAKLTKVSPALIYSIMKQESGFDVRARSHADAFGLLQLIPQVAKKAAQRMPSVDYQEPYDLYRPDVIIPLGANSLNHLFKKFDSNFILSVASYNASEHAVRGWIKSRYQGDPVTFIEDIPYEETKGYVKLVMRNYITYNRFQDKEETFHFPEVCLQGLGEFKR